MKPIKGMNLDVSPDAQPEGTYRIAKNFVYDAEFDGLQQDFGVGSRKLQITNKHCIASYSFTNGDIVLLLSDSTTLSTGQQIVLYKGSTDNTSVIVENDAGLIFDPSKVYDITHFEDANSQRHIIITGGGQKPLIFNIDVAEANQPDIGLSNLFPDRNLPTISQSVQTSGVLTKGAYFFSARYVLGETRTEFGPPFGPMRLIDNGRGVTLKLENLDTRYDKVEIGMIGVSNNAIITKVVATKPVTATTAEVDCSGESFGEALLEEIAILPQVYTSAEIAEVHDNRLYLGNVKSHDESGLQQKANAITTAWEIIKNATGAPRTNTGADPAGSFFAPGEVYAFYVAWVRDDGSMTQAYHIPGRPKKNFNVKVVSSAANLADSADPSIDVTSTIDELLADTSGANVNGQLNFLKNDRNVLESSDSAYGDTKFYQTRCTASKFTNKAVGPIDFHHGRMGYWENVNEQYPANFPTGRDIGYASSGQTVSSNSEEVLAGQKVRHHRMPSLGWLIDELSTPGSGFDFDSFQEHGLRMRFDFVEVPAGYQSAVIFHAVRKPTNSTVFTHTPIHFGAANHFAWFGNGGTAYKDYSTVSVINSRNANGVFGDGSVNTGNSNSGSISGSTDFNLINSAAGNPKEFDGTDFTDSDTHLNSQNNKASFKTQFQDRLNVHYNKAVAFSQDILATKPVLPKNMYTTFEYMLVQMEHFPTEVVGNTAGSTGRTHTMGITTGTGSDGNSNAPSFFETTTFSGGTSKSRRFLIDFTENYTGNVVQSFSHSRILPMRNQRYMPAGVIDDEVKFDNRRGAECFYWDYKNIANTETPYVGGHGNSGFTGRFQNAGDRLWFSVLNSDAGVLGDTASGNTDAARFQRTIGSTTTNHDQMDGYYLQGMPTTLATLAVCRLPFVTVMTFQNNCYLNRDTQDLSLCTSTEPVSSMGNAPTGTGIAAGLKTITSDKVFGDIHYSKTQYRVTSSTGYNVKLNASDEDAIAPVPQGSFFNSTVNTGVLGDSEEKGTFDGFRGVQIGLFKVNTYSPASYLFHNVDKLQHKEEERESLLRNVIPEETNDFTLNSDFLKVNNFLQPTISDGITALDFSFPYRVARSKAQDSASDALNLRTFPALDFIEQTRTRGTITNLQSFGDKLIIHHEDSLFISIGKEAVATTTGSVVLGTGDIFRVLPTELMPSEYGFAGSQHIQGCTLTPQGYFFVDVKRKRVFMYDGKINEISNKGMRKWFQDNLELSSFSVTNNQVTAFQPGIQAEYDPVFNRILLLIRFNALKSGGSYAGNTVPATYDAYENNTEFVPKDKVISYSLHTGAWVSLHDLQYNKFAATATKIYGIRTGAQGEGQITRVFELFDPTVATITYTSVQYNTTKTPAQIDLAFPAKEAAQWQSFSWHTKAVDHVKSSNNFGHYDLNTTFEKAAVYNDYQCSGDLTFTRANQVDITNVQRVTLRHNGTRNTFNGFRDLVNDTTARFLDPDYNFITANINPNKNWYEQRRLQSTYAVLRLISTLDTTKRLYLYDVDAKVRKSYR